MEGAGPRRGGFSADFVPALDEASVPAAATVPRASASCRDAGEKIPLVDLSGGLDRLPMVRAFLGCELTAEDACRFTFGLFFVIRSSVWPAQLQSSSQIGQSMSRTSSPTRPGEAIDVLVGIVVVDDDFGRVLSVSTNVSFTVKEHHECHTVPGRLGAIIRKSHCTGWT